MSNTSSNALLQRCEKCGTTATDVVPTPRSFRTRDALLCPKCRPRLVNPWLLLVGIVISIVVPIILQFSGRHPYVQEDASNRLITIWTSCAWILGTVFMVLGHECAHAAVACAVGINVRGISIGYGPRLGKWTLGKKFFELHLLPLAGVCLVDPYPGRGARWRQCMMIAAGPAIHLCAVILLATLWIALGWNRAEESTPASAITAVLFWLNVFFLTNLVPFNFPYQGMMLRSDGGQLFDLLIRRPTTKQPSVDLQTLSSLGDQGKWAEVQSAARALLKNVNSPHVATAYAAWLAVADVWMNGEENLGEADTLSLSCIQISPTDPAILTVRACVLLARHREDEAEKLLSRCRYTALHIYAEKAAAHLWTELHRRRNNTDQMHHWQSIAQKLDPTAAYKMFRDPATTPIAAPQLTPIDAQ